ncbi:hypothetical protein NLX71_05505 [Paenibacillus sp. MZ04-78.2]|uniref:hypothetical protein n=1 Tax=Paenibacillus sp. MZ04-78.2 TaxID=2962034 RepID=UPI0020B8EFBC|nr:hypothetical protein [Paenibacillus sp. MZ04-78.2]MCP3772776.1 hypothetical protein [Paenibacillus sp. MZ04-78.2]
MTGKIDNLELLLRGGGFNQLDSVAALQEHLAVLGVRLECFTKSSNVEEYPL